MYQTGGQSEDVSCSTFGTYRQVQMYIQHSRACASSHLSSAGAGHDFCRQALSAYLMSRRQSPAKATLGCQPRPPHVVRRRWALLIGCRRITASQSTRFRRPRPDTKCDMSSDDFSLCTDPAASSGSSFHPPNTSPIVHVGAGYVPFLLPPTSLPRSCI